jgi:uncharacterized membrane protein
VRPSSPGPAYTAAALFASLGSLESAYLTAVKLAGSPPALCGAAAGPSCSDVLSSPYASLFGLPLSALGCGAYALTAAAALAGASRGAEEAEALRMPLLACSTVLASVSAYLLATLGTSLGGALCPYCLTSAALSGATLAASLRGLNAASAGRLAAPGAALALATVLTVALPQAQAAQQQAAADSRDLPFEDRPLQRPSTAGSRALAEHLGAKGFRMLGAFWCSHCEEQRELFGSGARLPYTECFPQGYRKGVQAR